MKNPMCGLTRARWKLSPTFVIVMTIFIDITGYGMIIPLLPFYSETFQAGSTALGVLLSSFFIMQFIFSPILGRISDNVGRKPILLLSILTSTISFILFTLANSFILLLLSRIIAGVATETAVAQAYIADITKERERARGIGRVGAAHGAGFIIGPAIGGLLSVYGFWAPGLVAVLLTILNLLFVSIFLPESIEQNEYAKQTALGSDSSYLRKVFSTLTKPLIGVVLITFFIVFFAFSAIPVIVPLLGITFFGFGTVEMSYVFMYIGVIQIISQGFLIGGLADRFGEERLIAIGPLLMMFGIFLMPLTPILIVFLVSLTMIAFGNGMMRTIVPSFISKKTSPEEQGGMLGVTQSISTIAMVPGPIVGGFVFEFAGLTAPFFLSAAILLVAFLLGVRILQISLS